MTDELNEVFDCIEQIEHDMLLTQIFCDKGEYFVYAELNVNWWSPCSLYRYDRKSRLLREMCTLDHERIIGIRIRDRFQNDSEVKALI